MLQIGSAATRFVRGCVRSFSEFWSGLNDTCGIEAIIICLAAIFVGFGGG